METLRCWFDLFCRKTYEIRKGWPTFGSEKRHKRCLRHCRYCAGQIKPVLPPQFCAPPAAQKTLSAATIPRYI
jgi:hypothetical protein